MEDQYYYTVEGNRSGPVALSELKSLAARQLLKRSDKIWKEGMPSWQSAETLAEVFKGLPPDLGSPSPTPLSLPPEAIPSAESAKPNNQHSAGGLAILSFFLPGVGQMVCGQPAKGTIFLVVAIIMNAMTGGTVSLIICPFAAFDAYQIAKLKNAGGSISQWDFLPIAGKPVNVPAFCIMVGLAILLTIISLIDQQRAAEDQRFNSFINYLQSLGQ